MKQFSLHKAEKLCSRTAAQQLFAEGRSLMAYPLRAMVRVRQAGERGPVQFFITIPKKRVRHAVDRVLLRRRVREAYRLHRGTLLLEPLRESGADVGVDVAFVYVGSGVDHYAHLEEKVQDLLGRIAQLALNTPPQ